MACKLTSATSLLHRTANLVQGNSNYTAMVWFRPDADDTGVNYKNIMTRLDAAYTIWAGVFSNADASQGYAVNTSVGGAPSITTSKVFDKDTWYQVAYRKTGNTHVFAIGVGSTPSVVLNTNANVYTDLILGYDGFSIGSGTYAHFREWNVLVPTDDLALEFQSPVVKYMTGLVADCPLESDLLDISGNGNDFIAVGSHSFVTDPIYPTGYDAAHAVDLGSLPASGTLVVKQADQAYPFEAWYTYTAETPEIYIGGWFFGDLTNYKATTSIYSDAGVTGYPPHNPIANIENLRFQMPVMTGETYYFFVQPQAGVSGLTGTYTLFYDFLTAPRLDSAAGDLFINDDVEDFHAAIIRPSESYAVRQFLPFVTTNGEQGGDYSQANGNILINSDVPDVIVLYDKDLHVLNSNIVAGSTTLDLRFLYSGEAAYAGLSFSNLVYRITKDGVLTDTFNLTGISGTGGLGANAAETILYVSDATTNSNNKPVKRWDLAGSAFLTNLAAGQGAGIFTTHILVLSDDSILVLYYGSSGMYAKRHDPTGAVLNTYTLGGTIAFPGSMELDFTDPANYFLVRVQDQSTVGITSLLRVKISDGSIAWTNEQVRYQNGIYAAAVTDTPLSKFGVSKSCPFFPLTAAIVPTPDVSVTEYLIRRERWFPVVSHEQHRIFFHKLQLYFEAGTGISTGQGSNPLVELDWSDDGGHTWSNLHLLESGKIGEYKRRIIQRMLGQSRERIYRVAVSDPVQWSLIDAFFDLTEGTS